jgi:formyl-CoA transferase
LQEGAVVPETAQKLRVPVAAFGYAHGGPEHHSPAPRLGEHSREILAEAGISAREIDALHRDGVIHALSDSPRVASM